jgi:hypothetical protein
MQMLTYVELEAVPTLNNPSWREDADSIFPYRYSFHMRKNCVRVKMNKGLLYDAI